MARTQEMQLAADLAKAKRAVEALTKRRDKAFARKLNCEDALSEATAKYGNILADFDDAAEAYAAACAAMAPPAPPDAED